MFVLSEFLGAFCSSDFVDFPFSSGFLDFWSSDLTDFLFVSAVCADEGAVVSIRFVVVGDCRDNVVPGVLLSIKNQKEN